MYTCHLYAYMCRLDCNKYFIDKLKVEHVDFVGDYWTDKDKDMPVIKKYLEYVLTMFNYSVGVFLRSNPCTPVSWVAYSDYGHSVFLYTIPEYRNNGLSGNIMSNQYIRLLEDDVIPLGERIRGSILTEDLRHVEECVPGYTWRDSITGECYW